MNKNMIVPFEKKLPVDSPDKIPENASIEDYEKIAYKMSISSDEIIDRALDKLENHQQPAKKPRGRPKKNKKAAVPPASVQNAAPSAETATSPDAATEVVRDEPSPASQQTETRQTDGSVDEAPPSEAWVVEQLKAEIQSLNTQLAKFKGRINLESAFRKEIDELRKNNENLLLRCSDLEFEISRLRAENTNLKQHVEEAANRTRLPPQTNSKESYTMPPPSLNRGVFPRRQFTKPRMSMNGYETWN